MTEVIPRFGEDSLALIFQGQNVNNPQMGKLLDKFVAAKKVYDLATEILDFDVRRVCFGNLTHLQEDPEYVQPAIVTTELAEYRAWQDFTDGAKTDLITGLSLGMYTALAAAGSAEDATVIDISSKRARLVARNAKRRPGGMLSIKGIPHQEELDDLIKKTKTAVAIWWGGHGLVTLSGTRQRISEAYGIASGLEGVTAEISKVKEAAHNRIQERIQKPLTEVLEKAGLLPPEVALLSNDPRKNETAFLESVEELIRHYSDQMVEPVDMNEVNEEIALSGIARVLEIGPDRSFGLTSQLVRKCREEKISEMREQMGRGAIKRVKFDFDSLSA
ncbi:MAG TPA: acyltransferase domain-containing protein [Candidatus Saccharimonadales bacterium]|nr:acyltransferase domain-containing protein [Candidatus Saccharimonadales bacterium]